MTKEPAHNQVAHKHLKDILLLFSVPIGIIILLIALLYVPRLFANPTYDFIYCEGYSCDNTFLVDPSGRINTSDNVNYFTSGLHYYDVERDATRPLHIDEATRYRLDASSKSPDGYILKRTSSGGGFLFWDNYSNGWSLSRGFASKPISLDSGGYNNEFIGWVLP